MWEAIGNSPGGRSSRHNMHMHNMLHMHMYIFDS
jgi:hypothetical protein